MFTENRYIYKNTGDRPNSGPENVADLPKTETKETLNELDLRKKEVEKHIKNISSANSKIHQFFASARGMEQINNEDGTGTTSANVDYSKPYRERYGRFVKAVNGRMKFAGVQILEIPEPSRGSGGNHVLVMPLSGPEIETALMNDDDYNTLIENLVLVEESAQAQLKKFWEDFNADEIKRAEDFNTRINSTN